MYSFYQLKIGRDCITHYSNLRRFCVFSHDELVCKMSLDPDALDIGIATATYHDMLQMVEDEKKLRKNLLEWVSLCMNMFLERYKTHLIYSSVSYEKIT